MRPDAESYLQIVIDECEGRIVRENLAVIVIGEQRRIERVDVPVVRTSKEGCTKSIRCPAWCTFGQPP